MRRLLLGFVVFCLLLGLWLFPRLGSFLVEEDSFDHAEIGLILAGRPDQRALAARDLYHQGRVESILAIPEPRDYAMEEEMTKLGLRRPGEKHVEGAKVILLAAKVPQSKITLLPKSVEGTILEAPAVRNFFKGHFPKSMAVITAKFASRRACYIFRQVFKRDNVAIYCHPTSYDPFDPKRWWDKPRDALYVLMEYQKFFANVLTLAFKK